MDNISLGVKLASLREKMGLTQDDIAKKIHVRTAVIVDIENDRTIETSVVFIKGYIRSYAEIVGLPINEYKPYLDTLSQDNTSHQMRNYSQKNKTKKRGKWLLLISLLIIICALGITAYCVWKDSKGNFVEVSHYISPPPIERVNS